MLNNVNTAEKTSPIKKGEPVGLHGLELVNATVTLKSKTPLLMNRFTEKAKNQILGKQIGKANLGRTKRDPDKEWVDALYHIDKEKKIYGFPAIAFKQCMVTACSQIKDRAMSKVLTRGAVHINASDLDESGELVEIKGTPKKHEANVKLATGVADLRYRPIFSTWEAVLNLEWNNKAISFEQILHLLKLGGYSYGIGEHRPERNGIFGRFEVAITGKPIDAESRVV